jgi:hypothetical protein
MGLRSHLPSLGLGTLGVLPLLARAVSAIVWVWVLVAGVIAVRQALDFTTQKAALTVVFGWAVKIAFVVLLGTLLFTLVFGAAALGASMAR